jgi:IS5 family transposase
VEFGYKAQVADNDDGSSWTTASNTAPSRTPPNCCQRCSGSARAGRLPRAVTADRSYGEPAVERDLYALGVRTVAIPRKAKTSRARKTTRTQSRLPPARQWRTGLEGRISYLKRCYGWDRTRLDGRHGAAIWCGHGVFITT